jgi:hypothetical protein
MNRATDAVNDGAFVTYKLKAAGQKFFGGVSSRYENKYDRMLENVVSEGELTRIIDNLNEILVSNWPCTTFVMCGYLCLPCTFGLSLLGPGYCISYSEQHGQRFLRDVSLTARFYDKGISYTLVKSLCDTYVEINFPKQLLPQSHQYGAAQDLESGAGDYSKGGNGVAGRAAELSPLLNTISGGKSMKDN